MKERGQEAERVARVYAGMSDEELEKLAATGYDLSDVARQALQAEIAKRRLSITISEHPGFDVYELNELVTLRQFRDLHEALLVKGCLESAGIHAELVDDNLVRMDWLYSNLIGGIRLKVRPEDLETANEILEQPIPEQLEVEGVGVYEQPSCPRCQSLDVSYEDGSAKLSVPMFLHVVGWFCHSCGNQWERDSKVAEDLS